MKGSHFHGNPLLAYVGAARFELATSCSQSRRDDRATLRPENMAAAKSGGGQSWCKSI
jgi:hypothetical protein